jgi:hypothetical protein
LMLLSMFRLARGNAFSLGHNWAKAFSQHQPRAEL